MIESGYISWMLESQSRIDENGNPVVDDIPLWSELVPANIEGSQQRAYNDANSNRYIKSTYSIILPYDETLSNLSDRLRLYDGKKGYLGEYAVLSTQRLPILGEIRITV